MVVRVNCTAITTACSLGYWIECPYLVSIKDGQTLARWQQQPSGPTGLQMTLTAVAWDLAQQHMSAYLANERL